MYYGHDSWIVLVVFVGMFAIRALSSSRRRGRRYGGPMPRSPFTSVGRRGPVGGPTAGPPGVGSPPGIGGPPGVGSAAFTGTTPGWFTDPFVRHDQRYWSGTAWTEHVTDDGIPGTDPPPSSGQRNVG